MTKLEQLTEEIKKAIPRLMELTDGCIIEAYDYDRYIIGFDAVLLEKDLVRVIGYDYKATDFKIIGHPILLSDVLDFIYKSNAYIYSKTGEDVAMIHKCIYHYDLSKPYLKDQSEELIDYLHSLI
jgi:hypothetical protein